MKKTAPLLRTPTLAASRSAALAALAAALAFAAALGLASAVTAQPQPGACSVRVDKTAAPAEVRLGDAVTVTLSIDGACPPRERQADVILVIDRSYSMRTAKLDAAKSAARDFVSGVDTNLVHIGLVAISERPQLVQPLTSDAARLAASIDGLTAETGTNLVDAFDLAQRALTGATARPSAAAVIVFMTDGRHRSGPDISAIWPLVSAAHAAGTEVFAIALGTDADRDLLRRIATDAAHFFDSPTPAELADIYVQIAGRVTASALLASGTITDRVPANMTYVPGSGRPVQPAVSPDGRILTWALVDVKEPGTRLTYRLRPTESGVWPTNTSADLVYSDGFGQPGNAAFPVPQVKVTAPSAAPCVCRTIYLPWRVRAWDRSAVLSVAASDPGRYYGWNLRMDENKPGSPPYPEPGYDRGPNPRRTCLDLRNQNIPYHPLFNPPVWRAGCLVGPAPEP